MNRIRETRLFRVSASFFVQEREVLLAFFATRLLLWVLGWLVFCIIFLITVIKAFTGKRWEIPYIGPLAQKQMHGGA